MGVFGDQVAVVTGASRGIGRAIALALAAHGANLALVGRDADALGDVATKARATAPHVVCYQIDLAEDRQVDEFTARLEAGFGVLDILVHAAGTMQLGAVADSSACDLGRQYRINVHAPYVLTRGLLPLLRRNQGQIVFINSTMGLGTRAGVAAYAASKHALKALADTVREEVSPDGVRVLSVFPGRTATPGQAAIHAAERRQYVPDRLMQPEDVATMVVSALAVPRTAEVTDIRIRPMHKI